MHVSVHQPRDGIDSSDVEPCWCPFSAWPPKDSLVSSPATALHIFINHIAIVKLPETKSRAHKMLHLLRAGKVYHQCGAMIKQGPSRLYFNKGYKLYATSFTKGRRIILEQIILRLPDTIWLVSGNLKMICSNIARRTLPTIPMQRISLGQT